MKTVPPQTQIDALTAGTAEQYGQPKQTAQVDTSTGYISLSVGGDDLGFGNIGKACVQFLLNHTVVPLLTQPKTCQQQINASSDLTASLLANLAGPRGLYTDLLTRAPTAKLVVAGYPRIFPAVYDGVPSFGGTPYCILDHYPGVLFGAPFQTIDVGMPVTSAQSIDGFVVELNNTIKEAIAQLQKTTPAIGGRIRYADTYTQATPRNCTGTTPNATVAGFELSVGHGLGAGIKSFVSSATFHPTKPGQLMFGHAVARAFDQFVPLHITTADPPPFAVGQAVNFSIAATGGAPPYTFGITSAVPPWATTFDDRTLTGVISAGTWPITFQVQDAAGAAASRTYTFSTGSGGGGGGVVTSFAAARGNGYSITAGPDGALWFTDYHQNLVARITTDGEPRGGASVSHPTGIAAGPDGAMWATNQDGSAIVRITTAGTVANYTDPSIHLPTGISAGPDGALWFTNLGGETIGRITTAGTVTNYADPGMNSSTNFPNRITAGPDGAMWFTVLSSSGSSSIGRISTAGAVTNFTDPSIISPEFITTGPDGALWFTNHTGNSIGRITTAGAVTNYTDPSIVNPTGIAAGSDGALWFTNNGITNNGIGYSIGRITTAGRVTNYTDPSMSSPYDITAGPDGALWFTNLDNNLIGRITTP